MIVPYRLAAPQEDGARVADPPLEQVGDVLARNRELLASGPDILGRSWNELRERARHEATAAARDYLQKAGEPCEPRPPNLLLSGHQPELVHPGVWVKNFALNGLARKHGLTPINLIIDYDAVKATLLHVPEPIYAALNTAVRRAIPFDQGASQAPFEEREIQDRECLESLPERVAAVAHSWGYQPLLPDFWAEVLRQTHRTTLLGECLTAARRAVERRWGCHNLEVPVSALSRTEAFAWFVCHILADLPRFHAIYNETVHDYRRVYRLRSRSHPVPDLAKDGDWLEAPFWAWRTGQEQRDRLFVRRQGSGLHLRAGTAAWPTVSVVPAAWGELEAAGFKVRPRALTNTLFARLFLADLFIHGIGGGKYDELTDAIARRFYAIEPPRYLVFSGTLRLPLRPLLGSHVGTRVERMQRLRSVRYNPQRHLTPHAAREPEIQELLRQREAWIARTPATHRGRRERYAALRTLLDELRAATRREELFARVELAGAEQAEKVNAVLRRRDYAACLFPETMIREFCTSALSS